MKKTIVTLCTALVVVILVFGGLFALWYKGGSELSSHFVDINTGKPSPLISPRLFYRGIKISDEYGVALFKRYYMIAETDHGFHFSSVPAMPGLRQIRVVRWYPVKRHAQR